MKKIVLLLLAVAAVGSVQAWPGCHPGGWHHPGWHHPGWHHGGYWGRGGCNFWPGFVGGMIGGAIASSVASRPVYAAPTVIAPQPVVVQSPVVVQPATASVVVQQPATVVVQQQPIAQQVATPVSATRQVWVEGQYIDQVQNGQTVRVWNPGHYEQR